MKTGRTFITQKSDQGTRLDFFIARRLSCGQRAAKRLAASGNILVNGKAKPAHCKLSEGMEITVTAPAPEGDISGNAPIRVPLVAENADYAVFCKPGGLHTAKITGGSAPSLEEMLSGRFPPVTLLSRLDRETSGLVAAAFSPEAAERFRNLEAEGRIRKTYLALVRGAPDSPLLVRNALDTDNRKTTRVLAADAQDAARFTRVTPLPFPSPLEGTTVVCASIRRGARHQIRAHLAFAGFPVAGDPVYGGGPPGECLRLHHARLAMPGLTVFRPPLWLPGFLEEFLEDGPCVSRN